MLRSMIRSARAAAGSLPALAAAAHLRDEAFKAMAEVDIIHVPYRTGAEALPDLLTGRLDIMLDNIFLPRVRQGTPNEVIETIAKAMAELNKEPEIIERQMKIGWVPFAATPAELRQRMTEEIESYGYWVKKTNFKVD